MWRNTRYDLQDTSSISMGGVKSTDSKGRITRVGETLMCDGVPFYINGHGLHTQAIGPLYSVATRAEVDAVLLKMVRAGINAVSLMQMELIGTVASGLRKGGPGGMWDNGYAYSTGQTWAANSICYTSDTSGFTRVYRKYQTSGGASSGGATAGPTHTSGKVTVGNLEWTYLGPAYQAYDETFFTGSGIYAGFDYFMDACARAGIYVMIRFDRWETVFQKLTGGYALNGSAALSYGNHVFHRFLWPLDGTLGTPDMLSGMCAHIDQFLSRTNSVNGKLYKSDPTLHALDVMNEQGVALSYYSPSTSNTWDGLVKTGSTVNDATSPVAAVVAWWDAKWLAWFRANNGGNTPSVVYAGVLNTLPSYSYDATGAGAGPNIAVRSIYRNNALPNAWRVQVSKFLRETELGFFSAVRDYIKARSPGVMVSAGQMGYVFPTTAAAGDLCDNHFYPSSFTTTGNYAVMTITGTGTTVAGQAGITWAAGVLKVIANAAWTDSSGSLRTPLQGQIVRVIRGAFNQVVTISAVSTTTLSNDTFTAACAVDPGTGTTNASGTVTVPTLDLNTWPFHALTSTESPAAPTLMPWVDASAAPGTITNYTVSRGWAGASGLGAYSQIRDMQQLGYPAICTEMGERGIQGPFKGLCYLTYTLLDLLRGGSGGYRFAWAHYITLPTVGEHSIAGDGSAFLDAEIVGLLARYITPFPVAPDVAAVTVGDIDNMFARLNTGDLAALNTTSGVSCGYTLFSAGNYWQSVLTRALRQSIGAVSAPSAVTYSMANTGWVSPNLTNPNTVGMFYTWYEMGTYAYENKKVVIVGGRIPKDSADMPIAGSVAVPVLSKLKFKTIDGNAWYGRIVWVSLDGSDLGVGRSAIYTWMYPLLEGQVARRFFVDTGPVGRVETIDGDLQPVGAYETGVLMRDGLELQLQVQRTMTAYRLVQGKRANYYTSQSGNTLYLQPNDPRIVLE